MTIDQLDVPSANAVKEDETVLHPPVSSPPDQYPAGIVDEEASSSHEPLLRSVSPGHLTGGSDGSSPYSSHNTWRSWVWSLWLQGKGMVLVAISQFFGASMNVMTQLLEVDGPHGKPMHPFQVLFVRMSITVVVSVVYMWHQKIPNPLGTRETILLLLIRAGGGFFGVFSFYYSVRYMPLSEATVLTFLSPILVCYACSVLLPQEIFTRKQLLAGLVSLLGVVLIARPFSRQEPDDDGIGTPYSTNTYHHLLAVLVSMVGVLGSASALAAIRIIAQRAHPLVSVTYFSVCTTAVSTIALAAIPSIPFRLPGNVTEWALLLGLGICGFVMQFLLTAGLAYAPPSPGEGLPSGGAGGGGGGGGSRRSSAGSRATFMVYTQMLVALFYDKVIWNMTLTALSWAGSGLILGSAVYVAVAHEERYVQTQSPVSCEEEGIEIQQMSAENCKGDVTGQETGVEDVDLRH